MLSPSGSCLFRVHGLTPDHPGLLPSSASTARPTVSCPLLRRLPGTPSEGLPHLAWSCTSFSLRGCSFPTSPSTAGPQGLGGPHTVPVVPSTPQPYTPQADHGPPLDNFIFTYEKIRISLQRREVPLKQRGYRWSGLVSSVISEHPVIC